MSDKSKAFSFGGRQQGKSLAVRWQDIVTTFTGVSHGRDRTTNSAVHSGADQEPGDGAGAGDTQAAASKPYTAAALTFAHQAAVQDARASQLDAWRAQYSAMMWAALYGTSNLQIGIDRAATPKPPKIPNEGIRVGEIIAWRFWRVMRRYPVMPELSGHIGGMLAKYNIDPPRDIPAEPRLLSAFFNIAWQPDGVVSGEPDEWSGDYDLSEDRWVPGRKGVNGHKTQERARDHAAKFWRGPPPGAVSVRSGRIVVGGAGDYREGPVAIGTVALWGDVIEHEHGYRAQYGKINSLDAVLDRDAKGDELLAELRRIYGVAGDGS